MSTTEKRKEFEKEFAELLSEAIEHFDPSVEDDISMVTIIADIDKSQLIFGGLKLREDLEEEGEYDNDGSQVFYIAESKYLNEYFKTINKSYELFNTMSKVIDGNEELQEKLDGLLLYGWCKANEKMIEIDNFWSS